MQHLAVADQLEGQGPRRPQLSFGSYTLGGGSYVKVRTGTGTDTATSRYQGRSWYVWNNDKDTAYLCSATGVEIDTCYYNNRSASSVYC